MNVCKAKRAGRQAWLDGLKLNDCPYVGILGDAWRDGWLERDKHDVGNDHGAIC